MKNKVKSRSSHDQALTIMPWKSYNLNFLADYPLYFYVGAGLSMNAGLVGWNEMVCLIWWYLKHYEHARPTRCPKEKEPTENAEFLQSFVEATEAPSSWIRILSRESNSPCGLGRTALLNMMLRYRAPKLAFKYKKGEACPKHRKERHPRPGREPIKSDLELQSLIWDSGCSGVLTTNYDMLLEHAYSLEHGPALRSYHYSADFLRYLLSNRRFVLKLHGDINDIASMQFAPHRAWKKDGAFGGREGRGLDLKLIYKNTLERGNIIYVGCGFRDETIKELHGFWQSESSRPGPWTLLTRRIALIQEGELSRADLKGFEDIQFLTFGSGQWPQVKEFLKRVVKSRHDATKPRKICKEASDLHRQIFRSQNPWPVRRWKTDPWTCRSVKA